jgi:hypothetical protein
MTKRVINNNNKVPEKEDLFHKLSIQVSLNGLSFCVLDSLEQKLELNHVIQFEQQLTPYQLQHELRDRLRNYKVLEYSFYEVVAIHSNMLNSLVPRALFDSEQLANYIKYNARILPTDYLEFDSLSGMEIQNIYVPYTNINNYLFELFGEFEFRHSSSVLLETLNKIHGNNSDTIGYVHFTLNQIDFAIFSQKKLKYFNSFEISSEVDFLYYLLFALEQLGENPNNFKLRLVGDITEGDPIFETASEYFENLSILIPPTSLPNLKYKESELDFTLINSL